MKFFTKLAYLLIIIGTVYWSFSSLKPNVSNAAILEKNTGFSMQTALFHLKNITKETHYPGTKAHTEVQNYIVNQLQKLGLETEIQTQTAINKKWRAATTTENILAKIKGTENGKALLLLSHYDSNPHSALGASDAGSGVVTILESVRAFLAENKQPKNDIIILISDAEELGLLGAQAFVNYHPWTKNVGLVLNFEARGSGGPSYMLMETNGKNSKLLTELKKANPNFIAANSLMYSIYKMLPNDTDLTVFREKGDINGFNFAFIGDHFDYHSEQDSYQRLDRESLIHQADYLMATLPYFAISDLTNLNSDKDLVYVNFPFVDLLTYPFSWILPMLIIAIILFLGLIFFGISYGKLTFKGIAKGGIPFLVSLLIAPAIAFGLWKLLLIIHPQYQDILHGFTYNGYQYIIAFTCLTLYILFVVYNRFFKTIAAADLFIIPIAFWLLINSLIYVYLQGAGFFILPVFIALFILAILIFMNIRTTSKPILIAFLTIPIIFIFAPLIKMFPVGLGLKNLWISSLFIVLVFTLLVPIFHQQKTKNNLQFITGFLTILFFGIATFNSGFSSEKKKPNSLVFIQDAESKTSYWVTHNKTLDGYTKQIFDTDYKQENFPLDAGKSKYNTSFNFYKKSEEKNIKTSKITVLKDTVFNAKRYLKLTINPTRKINKYELFTTDSLTLNNFTVNGTLYDNGKPFTAKKGTLLIYQMANTDKDLTVEFSIDDTINPELILNEISYDLLSHPKFNIKPRSEIMMPMPFVINDAIICSQKIKL